MDDTQDVQFGDDDWIIDADSVDVGSTHGTEAEGDAGTSIGFSPAVVIGEPTWIDFKPEPGTSTTFHPATYDVRVTEDDSGILGIGYDHERGSADGFNMLRCPQTPETQQTTVRGFGFDGVNNPFTLTLKDFEVSLTYEWLIEE